VDIRAIRRPAPDGAARTIAEHRDHDGHLLDLLSAPKAARCAQCGFARRPRTVEPSS